MARVELEMSHYDCVLPVDFERLSSVLMPAWLDFIAGKYEPRAFADEFAPWQVGVGDIEYWSEDNWQEKFEISSLYIEWFRQRDITEWKTDTVRTDLGEALNKSSFAWCAEDLLMLAIKQTCAVEVSGVDPFEPTGIKALTPFRFYENLHYPPFVQVVGTKNGFRFLHQLYEFTWEKSNYLYTCVRKQLVSAETYELMEKLFLSVRAFPGTQLMRSSLVWPSADDSHLTGFLSPVETQELSAKIPEIEGLLSKEFDEFWPFDLFADRLQRAASCGAGLVSLFSGL